MRRSGVRSSSTPPFIPCPSTSIHAVTGSLKTARLLKRVLFFCGLLLQGCAIVAPQTSALLESWPHDLPLHAEIADAPFFPQDEYQCGPAALATALVHFGVPVTPEDLVREIYIPARKGSLQTEMLAVPRRHAMVSFLLDGRYADVLREIAAGTPVIVLQNYGVWPIDIWHYAVAVGYDAQSGDVVLRSGEKRRLTMPFAVFERLWKHGAHWAMVAVPPSRVPATAERTRYLDAIIALERAREPRAASSAYGKFLERWPGDVTASIGLANAYYALGELGRAEQALRQALAHHPDSVIVLNNLAQTISDSGRSAEALELIERAAAAPGAYAGAIAQTRALILQRIEAR